MNRINFKPYYNIYHTCSNIIDIVRWNVKAQVTDLVKETVVYHKGMYKSICLHYQNNKSLYKSTLKSLQK